MNYERCFLLTLSEEQKTKHRASDKNWVKTIDEKAKQGDPEAQAYKEGRLYRQKFSTAKRFITNAGKEPELKELKVLLDKRLKNRK